ncbi:hypothetical protein [Limoniibacter endophyticus]|uniref:Uncharacterized protein n=1 Tax=Limoniibacter endophyticus TaxID=1565040 RepID=A0A8J3DGP3_9HYPH|nr:hypothetical protein [Limoniibacter endophyticus]GHC65567.1 hypothetical protein GCM10010136_08340 [Limoniibacter endophyticus]
MRTPSRPPLNSLKQSMEAARENGSNAKRDGFVRETFILARPQAREKARECFERWPRPAYWTEIESWFERPGDVIEFTIRRLPTAD